MIKNLLMSVGAMKAGTTWLARNLRKHPLIEFTPIKELHYFYECQFKEGQLSPEKRALRAGKKAQATGWAPRFLADPVDDAWFSRLYDHAASDGHYCAEFSNLSCLLPPTGWEHVRTVSPNVKVLLGLRNPLQRLWSHTRFHATYVGAVERMPSMTQSEFAGFIETWQLGKFGHYSRFITTLEQQLPPDQYMITFFEEMVARPEPALRRITTFLDIPFEFREPLTMTSVNPGPDIPLSSAFVEAAAPLVEAELADLRRIGFAYPSGWHL